MDSFDLLPNERVVDILLNLDYQYVLSACKSNRRFRSICLDERFWIDKIRFDFNLDYHHILDNLSKYVGDIMELILNPRRMYDSLWNSKIIFYGMTLPENYPVDKLFLHNLRVKNYNYTDMLIADGFNINTAIEIAGAERDGIYFHRLFRRKIDDYTLRLDKLNDYILRLPYSYKDIKKSFQPVKIERYRVNQLRQSVDKLESSLRIYPRFKLYESGFQIHDAYEKFFDIPWATMDTEKEINRVITFDGKIDQAIDILEDSLLQNYNSEWRDELIVPI